MKVVLRLNNYQLGFLEMLKTYYGYTAYNQVIKHLIINFNQIDLQQNTFNIIFNNSCLQSTPHRTIKKVINLDLLPLSYQQQIQVNKQSNSAIVLSLINYYASLLILKYNYSWFYQLKLNA